MASSTVEDYIKQLYLEQQRIDSDLVSMGHLATAMGVTPGTATSMIKALSDAELVHYEPRTGVRLTRGGMKLALHVLRRHRLVEQLLVEVLGLDWAEVHEEAERLEHVISDRVLTRIDEVLGHPEVDPHGDPIPSARGDMAEPVADSLGECVLGTPMFVGRILDQDRKFLRFAERTGLIPGACVTVVSRDTSADAICVEQEGRAPIVLGPTAAAKILVYPEQPAT